MFVLSHRPNRKPNQLQLESKSRSNTQRISDIFKTIEFVPEETDGDFVYLNSENFFRKRYIGTPIKSQRVYHLKKGYLTNQTIKNPQITKVKPMNYISHVQKRTIQRQKKKPKKTNSEFSGILKYQSINLKPKQSTRDVKTSDTRCRCHKNSKSVDMKSANNQWIPNATKFRSSPKQKVQKQPITIRKPESWMLESWSINKSIKLENSLQSMEFSKLN